MIPQEADQTHIEYGFPVGNVLTLKNCQKAMQMNKTYLYSTELNNFTVFVVYIKSN